MRHGTLTVVCGCMYAGKTEELIRRLRREVFAKRQVLLVKPSLDTRYSVDQVVSHAGQQLPCTPLAEPKDLRVPIGTTVVGIDEVQFFDLSIVGVVEDLLRQGVSVCVAGLKCDWQGRPFPTTLALMGIADQIQILHAVCSVCGDDATHSHRLTKDEELVVLGGQEAYEARCRTCASQ